MSIENCLKCGSYYVDTDYNDDIYKVGFSMNPIKYTGKPKDYCPLCDECAEGVLERAGVTYEHYLEYMEAVGA